ncbi:ABC transporter substrate-binding protein [Cohnella silvisoli]|uniref:Extracellular solute-binding protein n=1 Tax=Cohnella silvisoli TaxID=2873699 RepID=A0ABV1KTA8_9BACL|nr:extracellular solute-binding protein [Cohnella silvisoli]MCD9021516.1 extracellular solute-binding protein [Cohnella silvisoli]
MNKKWASIGFVILLTIGLLTACGSNSNSDSSSSPSASAASDTPVASESTAASESPAASESKAANLGYLTWAYSDRTSSTDALIKDLKDKFNITIDMQNVPTDQYATTLKTKLASADLPDLVMIHGLDKALYSNGEKLTVDASQFADLSDLKSIAEFLPSVIEDRKKNKEGKLYYVPISTNALGVLYNKKVFADNGIAVPTNIDEFIAASEKLKAAKITPIAAGYKDAWTTQIIPFIAFGQYVNGKDMSTREKLADGSLKYSDIKDDVTKVLNVQQDWAAKGYFQDNFLGTDINVASQMVATGKAAMLINGTWQLGAIQGANPDAEIGFFPLPLNAAGEKTIVPTSADEGILINAKSKDLDAAKQAMDYYLSAENQTRVIADLNGIPTNTKVQVSNPFVKEVQASMAANAVQPDWWGGNGNYQPPGTTFAMDKELQNLVAKGITIDQFIKDYDTANAKALNK